jgi:nucleoside-diphosphate-sugar epimerase
VSTKKILIIGACGQIGIELTLALRGLYGVHQVVAADLRDEPPAVIANGPYVMLNVLRGSVVKRVIMRHRITEIYLLAATLSATGEAQRLRAWEVNMQGLLNILELAREHSIEKVFWPSSIAVFGPTSPKVNCPQETVMAPVTVYGISKLSGEMWCQYYHEHHGVDVRTLRYPGLISATAVSGGGATDYAAAVFHAAATGRPFTCFLKPDTRLPMMYIRDAIRATMELMDAPAASLSIRTGYNISAMHFSPAQLAEAIRLHIPGFAIHYAPDERQAIADSWPQSINDAVARKDWGWSEGFDLSAMVREMLRQLTPQKEMV